MIALTLAALIAAWFSGGFTVWAYVTRQDGYTGYEAQYAFGAFLGLVASIFGYLAVTL